MLRFENSEEYKACTLFNYCFDNSIHNWTEWRKFIDYDFIEDEANKLSSFLKNPTTRTSTVSEYILKNFKNYGFDPLILNQFEIFKDKCINKLQFPSKKNRDQACRSLFDLFLTAISCTYGKKYCETFFNKPLLLTGNESLMSTNDPGNKHNRPLLLTSNDSIGQNYLPLCQNSFTLSQVDFLPEENDLPSDEELDMLRDIPGLFNYCFKFQLNKSQEITNHDYINNAAERLVLQLKNLSETHSKIHALAISRYILKKFEKYGLNPLEITDYKMFKNKCKISSERFLNNVNTNQSCNALYNLFQSAIEGTGGIKYYEICSKKPILITSSETVGKDYLPSVGNEMFDEDILREITKYDLKLLNKTSQLSKKYKLIAKNIIHHQSNEIDFSDYKFKTFQDLIYFLNFLGQKKCQNIEKLSIPIDLLGSANKDIMTAIAINFPNVKHLSFSHSRKIDDREWIVGEERNEIKIEINNESFEFVKKLHCLESIDLSGQNDIIDIKWLAWVPELKTLNLDGCWKIRRLSILSDSKKLTSLNLSNRRIDSLNWIGLLTNLENLNLSKCELRQNEEFNQLNKLTKLKKLNLSKTNFNDIFHLTPLVEIKELDLSFSKINSNLEELKSLKLLKKLDLAGLKVDDLTFFDQLINLEYLDLGRCTSGVITLPNMPNLRTLRLDYSEITAIQPEHLLNNLIELNLNQCKLSKLDFLAFFPNLEKIDLSENRKIRCLTPCLDLRNLRNLKLNYCVGIKAPKDSEWKNVKNLRKLQLIACPWARDESFLKNLPNLKDCTLPDII